MFNFFSQNKKLYNNCRESIKRLRRIVKKNAKEIGPETVAKVSNKISELEQRLNVEDLDNLKNINAELLEIESTTLSKFTKSKLRQNIESLLVAIALALFIREFVIQPFKIPSGSMIPNLLVGDHLLVSKFIYGTKIPYTNIQILPGIRNIKYGDVIVFKYPNADFEPSKKGLFYIKRVVGLPGDELDIKGRNLYINNKKISLEYKRSYHNRSLNSDRFVDEYEENLMDNPHLVIYENQRSSTDKGEFLPYDKIPEDHYFVMGDNRDNSRDSRYWGLVPLENVAGKALITHWSWDLENDNIMHKVRWNRIFKPIK